jgi:hypothetical protein
MTGGFVGGLVAGLTTNLTEVRFRLVLPAGRRDELIRCRLDHFQFQECAEVVRFHHLEQGTHTITVKTVPPDKGKHSAGFCRR